MNRTLTAEAVWLSCDFYTFPSVKAIQKEFGFKGTYLIITILLDLTSNGFKRPYDRSFINDVSRVCGITPNLVRMVVRRMAFHGLLDKESFIQCNTVAIPSEYIMLGKEVKNITSIPYYIDKSVKKAISSEETIVNSEETPNLTEETILNNCFHLNNTYYGTSKETRS